ncbi:AraC family transcriptional regulator [Acinetobacter stercoris]|uniref:Transcriptional activator FtrA n=1 Tax=Acinetobacter stercoris TaxID=2126983 RepID=A0A2U3MZH1_9GAMM|nr:helix-turn-helix transcriptional regulator [Acinetobacter stercoris]SPL70836.1 transcriptional activator FtrA [Acinetobacter stercoris]
MIKNEASFLVDILDRSVIVIKIQEQVPDWELALHHHAKSQLLITFSGLITVETQSGIWIVPPNNALWIPAGVEHQASCFGYSSGYVVFIHPKFDYGIDRQCSMYHTTDFLNALVKRTGLIDHAYTSQEDERLMQCLIDEIRKAPQQVFHLPMTQEYPLKTVTTHLIKYPEQNLSLKNWAEMCCMSERSLTRAFSRKMNMSINQWRRRLHILLALQWLNEGKTVHQISIDLGYDSDTSFIVMFKQIMHMSPKKYLEKHQQPIEENNEAKDFTI